MAKDELLKEIDFRLSQVTFHRRMCVEMFGLKTAENTYKHEFEFLEALRRELTTNA